LTVWVDGARLRVVLLFLRKRSRQHIADGHRSNGWLRAEREQRGLRPLAHAHVGVCQLLAPPSGEQRGGVECRGVRRGSRGGAEGSSGGAAGCCGVRQGAVGCGGLSLLSACFLRSVGWEGGGVRRDEGGAVGRSEGASSYTHTQEGQRTRESYRTPLNSMSRNPMILQYRATMIRDDQSANFSRSFSTIKYNNAARTSRGALIQQYQNTIISDNKNA
jgi:hypothetical protein